jgi:hypothetical protein
MVPPWLTSRISYRNTTLGLLLFFFVSLLGGCAQPRHTTMMEVTAYCGCGSCCGWQRGSRNWLYLNFWSRYITYGPQAGMPYSGMTASGTKPREPQAGLLSLDSLHRPWLVPHRLLLFPWFFLPEDGTIAADTSYYPFGTRMKVPGYGWGVVEDRGGAIKGPTRIDVYFRSHDTALQWGRQHLPVQIEPRR